jgi:hypothetical protein
MFLEIAAAAANSLGRALGASIGFAGVSGRCRKNGRQGTAIARSKTVEAAPRETTKLETPAMIAKAHTGHAIHAITRVSRDLVMGPIT